MKKLGLLLLLITSPYLLALDSVSKKSKKPGVDIFFLDSNIIQLVPNKTETLEIKLQFTAESIDYVLTGSAGLEIQDLKQSSIIIDPETQNKILSIPLELRADAVGRYYLHIQFTSLNKGVELQTVMSKIVSTEIARPVLLKKPLNAVHVLPSSETIIKSKDKP